MNIQMDQVYHCNECDINFPDKQIATDVNPLLDFKMSFIDPK